MKELRRAVVVGEGCDGRWNKMGEKQLRGDDRNWWVPRHCPAVVVTDLVWCNGGLGLVRWRWSRSGFRM
ncbi:hypothetical protein I3760_09G185500 [Carya illinoinensis]|nr:hypothetical protein I3760_09G185500 [Carya illinoinensis]